jgi:hypothetical protein
MRAIFLCQLKADSLIASIIVKRRVLSRVLLKKYRVSVMLPTRPLSLVDTTGSNLNKLSVDSSLFASINNRLRTRKPSACSRGMNWTS